MRWTRTAATSISPRLRQTPNSPTHPQSQPTANSTLDTSQSLPHPPSPPRVRPRSARTRPRRVQTATPTVVSRASAAPSALRPPRPHHPHRLPRDPHRTTPPPPPPPVPRSPSKTPRTRSPNPPRRHPPAPRRARHPRTLSSSARTSPSPVALLRSSPSTRGESGFRFVPAPPPSSTSRRVPTTGTTDRRTQKKQTLGRCHQNVVTFQNGTNPIGLAIRDSRFAIRDATTAARFRARTFSLVHATYRIRYFRDSRLWYGGEGHGSKGCDP